MQTSDQHFRIECHERAATLYVAGPLSVAGAWRALRLCHALPSSVTALRIDLRAASLADPAPLQALSMLLVRWRGGVAGRRSRIDLPPAASRPSPATLATARRQRAPRPARLLVRA